MKILLVTIGKPKLPYAQAGWQEYVGRLRKLHSVEIIHLADKYASDSKKIKEVTDGTYRVGLVIGGRQCTSPELAGQLERWQGLGRPVSFSIGGPDGLPPDFIAGLDEAWSLGTLTLPHDLAMVVTAEALYRATTILNGYPYHH